MATRELHTYLLSSKFRISPPRGAALAETGKEKRSSPDSIMCVMMRRESRKQKLDHYY